jgi:hypothetical protein
MASPSSSDLPGRQDWIFDQKESILCLAVFSVPVDGSRLRTLSAEEKESNGKHFTCSHKEFARREITSMDAITTQQGNKL